MRILKILACLFIGLASIEPTAAQERRKIYISVDLEGITGVVTDQQLGPEGFEYERFRKIATGEVNACVETLRESGVEDIVISDSHGNGQNLLIEELPDDVEIIRSWPRRLGMMEGIDETFDGAILLGYHTATTNMAGVRAHTFSSANITAVRLNGIAMSEAGINAAIAGHFDVPVIMVSGDDATIEESKALLGDVEGAIVKWAYSFQAARSLTPSAGREVIRQTTKAALARLDDFVPYRPKPPLELTVSLKNYRPVELLAYLPIVERIDSHTIRFVGKDMPEIAGFFEFMLGYNVSLSP